MKYAIFVMVLCVACAPQSVQQDSDLAFAGIELSTLPTLERQEFNRLAALENVPLYWKHADFQPSSFVVIGTSSSADAAPYIQDGEFTERFDAFYARLVNRRRMEAVQRELDSGWLIAITTDMRDAPSTDRQIVRIIAEAGNIIEDLYATQLGTRAIGVEPHDMPSRELLRRTHGYRCEGPKTRDDPYCHALITYDRPKSDAYPRDSAQDAAFCESLRTSANGNMLMDPFSVVRRVGKELLAVPYTDVYGDRMRAVAKRLHSARALLDASESAFAHYLDAAAKGFETNDWDDADEAWISMNSENSKWYLRIAPDEVYFDPCNSKAGFHLSFARINTSLLEWKNKLTPLRSKMEETLATHIGAPYRAREVSFALPDFIDVILNAGDSRDAFGATVGQSLPNWGPVAERGAGRTVVMTNLYNNADSRAVDKQKAKLLLDAESLAHLSDEPITQYLDILLHEATHNFGPHSDYQLDGKPPRLVFGGKTASILEELKAQVGALWFTAWLNKEGMIDDDTARAALTHSIMWCFGQLSRGLFDADGNPSVYPSIAAIQVGYFLNSGALVFTPDGGDDQIGRFSIRYPALNQSVNDLMHTVGQIKATGDTAAAKALIEEHTGEPGRAHIRLDQITERVLRFPKESFSYAIVL